MSTITIPVMVGADRHLVIDLPEDVPIGPAELTIKPRIETNTEREAIRAKLLAANFLVIDHGLPEDFYDEPFEEGWDEPVDLPSGARPSEALINEDRGLY